MIVAEAHRKSGLGRRLIQYVVDHPMLARVRHIELYCKPELIPFYEQCGFSSPEPEMNFLRVRRQN